MSLFKRGSTFFHFWFEGRHIQRSTKQSNRRAAQQIEAAFRTALAKGEVGIFERPPVPTLKEFSQRFVDAIQVRCASKPRTVDFYAQQLKRLLEFEPLANARLTDIDECTIESYVQHRSKEFVRYRTRKGIWRREDRQVSPSTVNRGLATLRRLMRLAQEWRVIDRVPHIRLVPGERSREFVLGYSEEKAYLEIVQQPLRDIATLVLDTGMRIGEVVALEWRDVHLNPNGSRWGYIQIREGKSHNARRAIPLTSRAQSIFAQRRTGAQFPLIFADSTGQIPCVSTLDHLHAKVRRALRFPHVFVLHSLRHTYLTRLGLAGVEAFTIMKLAGHSSVTVSQRYVHPTPQAMEEAVARLDKMNTRSLKSGASHDTTEHLTATFSATAEGAIAITH